MMDLSRHARFDLKTFSDFYLALKADLAKGELTEEERKARFLQLEKLQKQACYPCGLLRVILTGKNITYTRKPEEFVATDEAMLEFVTTTLKEAMATVELLSEMMPHYSKEGPCLTLDEILNYARLSGTENESAIPPAHVRHMRGCEEFHGCAVCIMRLLGQKHLRRILKP